MDPNLECMLHAKMTGAAPPGISDVDPVLEIEVWRSYQRKLLAELQSIETLLATVAPSLGGRRGAKPLTGTDGDV